MQTLLDPKNDYVFKRLFADAPALLCALVNAVRTQAPPITRITVKNPTIDPDELRGKYIILDLLAEDAHGRLFNIEMQVRRHRAWSARSAFYLARLLSGQMVPGDEYTTLKPVVGIHLLDFDLFEAPEHQQQALWCFEMRDGKTPSVSLGQELQLHLIELRKADRLQLHNAALAPWVTLFKHWKEETIMAQLIDTPAGAAYDKLKHLSADAEAQRLAFVRARALSDERSLLRDAREEGWEEGLEKGREEGERDAQRGLVLRLLQRRLGALTEPQGARVADLNSDSLLALGEALLDFQQPADLDAWLNAGDSVDH